MSEIPDPRALDNPLLADRGLSLAQEALPCGLAACDPAELACVQDSDQSQWAARRACAAEMTAGLLARQYDKQASTIEAQATEIAFLKDMVRQLSIDERFGIMTVNSLKVVFRQMAERGILERLRGEGWAMELEVWDKNWLKSHNTLGHHEGGDVALGLLINKLLPLYQRKNDLIGVLEYLEQAGQAANVGESLSMISRYESGDEIVVFSLVPPSRVGDRRSSVKGMEDRRDQIITNLEGVEAVYSLAEGKTPESARAELDSIGSGLTYRIENSLVYASVSATFAIVRAPLPPDLQTLKAFIHTADVRMGNLKGKRRNETEGVVMNLLD